MMDWTTTEIQIMRKYYGVIPLSAIAEMLPNRKIVNIQCKASELRKKYPDIQRINSEWSEADNHYIIEHYAQDKTPKEIGIKLNRTGKQVTRQATHLRQKGYKIPMMARGGSIVKGSKEQLCWTCKWASNPKGNKCSWSGLDKKKNPRFEIPKGCRVINKKIVTCPLYTKG